MYCFDSVVRYSELDADGQMSLPALLNLMQDCCTFHSEEIGVGVRFLQQEHRAWVLSFWQVIVERRPKMGERLLTYTWPYAFKGFLGNRNFKIEDSAGAVVACANSIWTYLNTETGRPARIPLEVQKRYVFDPPCEMECAGRKIPPEADMEPGEPLRVGRFHIDTNHHVNNVKYIMAAQEYLPEHFKVREFRAEYKKAAVLSDIICPRVKQTEKRVLVSLESEAAEPYAVIEFRED